MNPMNINEKGTINPDSDDNVYPVNHREPIGHEKGVNPDLDKNASHKVKSADTQNNMAANGNQDMPSGEKIVTIKQDETPKGNETSPTTGGEENATTPTIEGEENVPGGIFEKLQADWKTIAIVTAAAATTAALIAIVKKASNGIKVRFQKTTNVLYRMQKDFSFKKDGLDMKAVLPGIGSKIRDVSARFFRAMFKGKARNKGAIGMHPFVDGYKEELANDYKMAADAWNKVYAAGKSGEATNDSINTGYKSFYQAMRQDAINEGKLNEFAVTGIGAMVSLGLLAFRAGKFIYSKVGKNGKIDPSQSKAISVTKQSTREVCYAILNNFMGKFVDMEAVSKKMGVDIKSLGDIDQSNVDNFKKLMEKYSNASSSDVNTTYARVRKAYSTMCQHYYKIGDGLINNFEKYSREHANKESVKKNGNPTSASKREKHDNLVVAGTEKLRAMWDKQKDIYDNCFSNVMVEIVSSREYQQYLKFILDQVIPVFKTGLAGDADPVLDIMPKKGEYYIVRQTSKDAEIKNTEGRNNGIIAVAQITKFDEGKKEIEFKRVAVIDKVDNDHDNPENGIWTIPDDAKIDSSAYKGSKTYTLPYSKWLGLDPHLCSNADEVLNGKKPHKEPEKKPDIIVFKKDGLKCDFKKDPKKGDDDDNKVKDVPITDFYVTVKANDNIIQSVMMLYSFKLENKTCKGVISEIDLKDKKFNIDEFKEKFKDNGYQESDFSKVKDLFDGKRLRKIKYSNERNLDISSLENFSENFDNISMETLYKNYSVMSSKKEPKKNSESVINAPVIYSKPTMDKNGNIIGKDCIFIVSNIKKNESLEESIKDWFNDIVQDVKNLFRDTIDGIIYFKGIMARNKDLQHVNLYLNNTNEPFAWSEEDINEIKKHGFNEDTTINSNEIRKHIDWLKDNSESVTRINVDTPAEAINNIFELDKEKENIANNTPVLMGYQMNMDFPYTDAPTNNNADANSDNSANANNSSNENIVKNIQVNNYIYIDIKEGQITEMKGFYTFKLFDVNRVGKYNINIDDNIKKSLKKVLSKLSEIGYNKLERENLQSLPSNTSRNISIDLNKKNISSIDSLIIDALQNAYKNGNTDKNESLSITYDIDNINESYNNITISRQCNTVKDSYLVSESVWDDGTSGNINISLKSNIMKMLRTCESYNDFLNYVKSHNNMHMAKCGDTSYTVSMPANRNNILEKGNRLYESVVMLRFNSDSTLKNVKFQGIHVIMK